MFIAFLSASLYNTSENSQLALYSSLNAKPPILILACLLLK